MRWMPRRVVVILCEDGMGMRAYSSCVARRGVVIGAKKRVPMRSWRVSHWLKTRCQVGADQHAASFITRAVPIPRGFAARSLRHDYDGLKALELWVDAISLAG
jgi:hypothetical protein